MHLGKLPEVFDGRVTVEEKIDGSAIGFGIDEDNNIVIRSKGRQLFAETVDKMFAAGVASIMGREKRIRAVLLPGMFVYGEYLSTPSHNTLSYERVPQGHIALYGGTDTDGEWLTHEELTSIATLIDLDVVPLLMEADFSTVSREDGVHAFKALLETESYLGKEKIEGVVVKNYGQLVHMNGRLHPVFSKYVSADFKERHGADFKGEKDYLGDFIANYKADTARWVKAVHRLRDDGVLVDDVKDIGPIIKAVGDDLMEEEADTIKEFLFSHFRRQIVKVATSGIPEWYKERLLRITCTGCTATAMDASKLNHELTCSVVGAMELAPA